MFFLNFNFMFFNPLVFAFYKKIYYLCHLANPLACAIAAESIDVLLESDWVGNVQRIEAQLKAELRIAGSFKSVKEVRVLGAIGVLEMHDPVDLSSLQARLVAHGVWVRPFGKLVYIMPPFIITPT